MKYENKEGDYLQCLACGHRWGRPIPEQEQRKRPEKNAVLVQDYPGTDERVPQSIGQKRRRGAS